MKLEILIRNVQDLKSVAFAVDLGRNSIICIAGKNGSGKTTMMKAVKNLISADTFSKTSSTRSFSLTSEIRYRIDAEEITFRYDNKTKMMDSRSSVSPEVRRRLYVELPIPHGERFNFFQQISENDAALRSQVVLKKYVRPDELIRFLQSIYATTKFENLVEIRVKKIPFYVIAFEDNYYLREDFFSSGEYFLISIYRKIILGYIAIFIDEIDISLDAAAQVRLVHWLRKFKEIYNTTFVFTTHSLAMMKMLEPEELFYMEVQNDLTTTIENKSYSFIKSTLFGFKGWDKYILTEDVVLKNFVEHLISKHCKPSFFQHKTIYVGGGTNTTDLMERNKSENFFSKNSENVIVLLDGDQRKRPHSKKNNVYCIPMESVEKELLARCLLGEFWDLTKLAVLITDHVRLIDFMRGENNLKPSYLKSLFYGFILKLRKTTSLRRKLSVAVGEPAKEKDFKNAGKKLYKHLIDSRQFTQQDIFDFLIKKNSKDIDILCRQLEDFICLDSSKSGI